MGSTWSWMENMYNKMRRKRETNKIVKEGEKKLRRKRSKAFFDYLNRIFNLFAIIS